MHSHISGQLPFGAVVYAPSTEKAEANRRAAETRRSLLRASAEASDETGAETGWTVGGRQGSSSGQPPRKKPEPSVNGEDEEAEPISMWA